MINKKKVENKKCNKIDKGISTNEGFILVNDYLQKSPIYENSKNNKNLIFLKISYNDIENIFVKSVRNKNNNNISLKNSFKIQKINNLVKSTKNMIKNAKIASLFSSNTKLNSNHLFKGSHKEKYKTIKTSEKFLMNNLYESDKDNSSSKNITYYEEESKFLEELKQRNNSQNNILLKKNLKQNNKKKINKKILHKNNTHKLNLFNLEKKLPLINTYNFDKELSSTISFLNINKLLGVKKLIKPKFISNMKKTPINKYKNRFNKKNNIGNIFLTKFLNEIYENKKRNNNLKRHLSK